MSNHLKLAPTFDKKAFPYNHERFLFNPDSRAEMHAAVQSYTDAAEKLELEPQDFAIETGQGIVTMFLKNRQDLKAVSVTLREIEYQKRTGTRSPTLNLTDLRNE